MLFSAAGFIPNGCLGLSSTYLPNPTHQLDAFSMRKCFIHFCLVLLSV